MPDKAGLHLHHELEVSNIQLENFQLCFFPNENFHTLIPYPDKWVDFFTKDSVALEVDLDDEFFHQEPLKSAKSKKDTG